ncbi:MAG: VIT1/CCC1 transporter family protein [Candidatus Pacebacteria bacterium]|nr:VIT1/CCC1 transporter family protein [Candidatus Paceibacterota bacterium]
MKRERFVRNLVFGVEDSLVSTVGFISGIAAASVNRRTLLLSGIVLICVEAFSMGIGSIVSEESALEAKTKKRVSWSGPIAGGLVMFASYILTGALVLLPYFTRDVASALPQSIAVSLTLLFLLGAVSAFMSGLPVLLRAVRMMVVGGLAIVLGVFVGSAMP